MPSSTAKLGTQIIGATNHKNISSTAITGNVSTGELLAGNLYIVDDTGGSISITVDTAPNGSEFHFVATVLVNGIGFVPGTCSVWAPSNATNFNRQYTHVTLKYIEGGSRAILIPSDPLV